MNFAALVAYARQNPGRIPPPFYRIRRVDWVLNITAGELTVEPCGERDAVPAMRRSGPQPPPLLAVDQAVYVLGATGPGITDRQATTRADAFWSQMGDWLTSRHTHPAVGAAITLLHTHGVAHTRRQVPARDTVAVRVEGVWLHRLGEAVAHWAGLVVAAKSGPAGMCTACRRVRPLADSIPNSLPEHLVPGADRPAQVAVLPMHQRQGKATLPLCVPCGDTATAVLETLLADPRHGIRLPGQDTALAAFGLGGPDADAEVVDLLGSVVAGRRPDEHR